MNPKMKQRLLFLALAALLAISPLALTIADEAKEAKPDKEAKGQQWTEDYAAAQAESKKTGKPILIDFTGSDWCGFCVRQSAEVFSTEEWKKWAVDHVVLFKADYPRKPQTDAIKKQNAELKAKFAPRGYPTIVFATADGTELGRWAGYGPGTGVAKWIERATPILAKAKEAATEKK